MAMNGLVKGLVDLAKKVSPFKFGYEATVSGTRRKAPVSDVKGEDDHLNPIERRALISTTRDLRRNFALSAWMIRKHLDFVATHEFQSKTGNKEFDEKFESLMLWWGNKRNFDVAERHSMHGFIRLAESGRCVDGDFFIQKTRKGRLVGIEGDRIANPVMGVRRNKIIMKDYKRGVKVNKAGKAVSYLLNNRVNDGSQLQFDRTLNARDIIHFSYWDRIDQIRGISPLAPGINPMQDTREAIVYALGRAKVSQLFALALKRSSGDSPGQISGGTDADGDEDKSEFVVDFNTGPVQLDLDPEDEATFLESKQPSTELQTFLHSVIGLALKSLDIPLSFYDEAYTNYSGARQALVLYFQSAKEKQRAVQDLLNELTHWRLMLWILDGIITLPGNMTISDVLWEWHPAGIPWIDPAKETIGDMKAVELGVSTRQQIVKRAHGKSWKNDVLPELKEEKKLMEEAGLIDKPVVKEEVAPNAK